MYDIASSFFIYFFKKEMITNKITINKIIKTIRLINNNNNNKGG